MKNVLLCLSTLSCFGLTHAEEPSSYDFTKINQSITSALQELTAESKSINSVEYSFLPEKTDVDAGRFTINYAMDLAEAAWSEDGVRSSGEFSYTIPVDDGNPSFEVDMTVDTDALALLKQKMQKKRACKSLDSMAGLERVLLSRHCELVAKLADVSSIAELHQFVKDKLAGHREDVSQYHTAISEHVSTHSPAAEVRALLDHEISKAEDALDFLDKVVIKETTEGFHMSAPAFDKCPPFASQGLELDIAPKRIMAKGELTLKWLGRLYQAAMPTVKKILKALESNEGYAEKFVQFDIELLVDLLAIGE